MNRNLRLTALTFASILALTPLASAQQAQTSQTQTTSTPALTAQNSAQRPMAPGQHPGSARPGRSASFTLVRKVDALNELGKAPRTALSSAQARQLSALLSPLKTAKTLTTAQATALSASIDRLLTPGQRAALAQAGSRMGGRGQHMQGQREQTGPQNQQGRSGQRGAQQGQRPGDHQGPQGGQMQPGQAGMAPDSNPFLNGRGSQVLGSLLGQLQK